MVLYAPNGREERFFETDDGFLRFISDESAKKWGKPAYKTRDLSIKDVNKNLRYILTKRYMGLSCGSAQPIGVIYKGVCTGVIGLG